MDRLKSLRAKTLKVFDLLCRSKIPLQLNFSGGKDSHVLLGMYMEWQKFSQKRLDLHVVFSDTQLETIALYGLVERVEQVCNDRQIKIKFVRTSPALDKNFWILLFGQGYPVPNHRNRWCTEYLKVRPMKTRRLSLTGSHFGESIKRDNRLRLNNSCGSSECGIDMISGVVEPIRDWTNCDVWDWIILYGNSVLYEGVLEKLQSVYAIAEEEGSLRMGCFLCPVVAVSTIRKNVNSGVLPSAAIEVRSLLEKLRADPRICSPRTGKLGAILVDARIQRWQELSPLFPELKAMGWISESTISRVDQLLKDRTYPQTYSQAWIFEQEQKLREEPKADNS